jgi:folate-dependent phosphoribosylglycinamide formyltransferase PurN
MKHIVFFSQTGSEIANLYKQTGHKPDLVITNRKSLDGINEELKSWTNIVQIPFNPTTEDYLKVLPQECIITLHGYLRILPKDITDKYEIYNGHPGLITYYPELKGKDPQERAYLADYKYIGVVIHKVIAEVDEGEVLLQDKTESFGKGWDDTMEWFYSSMLNLWVKFYEERLLQ